MRLIDADRSQISKTEKVDIVLVGLPSEFDAVLTLASFSSKPLPLQRLVDVLLEFESKQIHAIQEASLHAHSVEATPSPMVVNFSRDDCPPASRGKGFRSRVQCQICGRFRHLDQRCYYRFNRDYGGPALGARASSSSGFADHGSSVLYAAMSAPMTILCVGLPSMAPQSNFPSGW